MNRTGISAVFFVMVIVASGVVGVITIGTTNVTAQPSSGEPRLYAVALEPNATVTPGETAMVTVQVSNSGTVHSSSIDPKIRDRLTTARNVRMEVDDEGPFNIRTNEKSLGTIGEDTPREIDLLFEVPDDVDPGRYDVDLSLTYSHAAQITGGEITNDRARTIERTIEVEVDDAPRFEFTNVHTTATVGDSGSMAVDIENVGADTARNVTIALESKNARLRFGESRSESAGLDRLEPGETATLEYDISVDDRASVRPYPIESQVTYRDSNGVGGHDASPDIHVVPNPEQRFRIDDVESTLRVGEDGYVAGVVTNSGPHTVRSVVVEFATESTTATPIETSYAVGSVESGQSRTFRLPVAMSDEAEPISREFDLVVRYRNLENEARMYDDVSVAVPIEERRDEFLVESTSHEIPSGSTAVLPVEVTNNLDETVTDVEPKLFGDGPIEATDDSAYIPRLDPGETTTVHFEVAVDDDSVSKPYAGTIDVRYDDADGTSRISGTHRTAITVVGNEDTSTGRILALGLVLVLAIVIGAVVYRRRNRALDGNL
ncbi:MAG: COG1361 S-layer family protein [Natronomonas sp.]